MTRARRWTGASVAFVLAVAAVVTWAVATARPTFPDHVWVVVSGGRLLGGLPGVWFPVPIDALAAEPGGPTIPSIRAATCDIDDEPPPLRAASRPVRPLPERLRSFAVQADAEDPVRRWLVAAHLADSDVTAGYERTGRVETAAGREWREFRRGARR